MESLIRITAAKDKKRVSVSCAQVMEEWQRRTFVKEVATLIVLQPWTRLNEHGEMPGV
jgi:hypothetical protein